MKNKKTPRGRLIAENLRLREQISIELVNRAAIQEKYEGLQKRFDDISGKFEMAESGGPIITLNAEAQYWGQYVMLSDMDDEDIEYAKKELARQIANGLLDNNILQFIVRHPEVYDPLSELELCTIGAKLAVVPWDQLAMGKRFEFKVRRRCR